jgi:hypothetical protein
MRLRGNMIDLSPDQVGLHGEPRFSSSAGGSENFSWLARTARSAVYPTRLQPLLADPCARHARFALRQGWLLADDFQFGCFELQ